MTGRQRDSEARRDEQLGATIGAAAVAAVGVAMFVFQRSADPHFDTGSWPLGWIAYGIYLAAFTLDLLGTSTGKRWISSKTTVLILFVSGVALHFTAPPVDFFAVLFVVTAAAAAFELSTRSAATIVVVQTIVVGVASAMRGVDTFVVVLLTTLYLAFQVFAIVVVRMARREAEAREELAEANEELAAAINMLSDSTRNAERLRIARELHDVVGHQLTALAIELEIAGHHVEGPASTHVDRARTFTKELLEDIRQVVSELREAPQGLESSLRRMLGGLPGLDVDLDVVENLVLEETTALAVVRLVQEVSTNTLRHASATRLTVTITTDHERVHIDARDDGRGAVRWQMGSGLLGMEERFVQLGGRVEFDPGPGTGFGVSAWLPTA